MHWNFLREHTLAVQLEPSFNASLLFVSSKDKKAYEIYIYRAPESICRTSVMKA
jgi:hypothetical protein